MTPKKRQALNEMQRYVMHLRYRLVQYQLDGIDPPEYLLNELKVAENLAILTQERAKNFPLPLGSPVV
jgi:hypothetical protein